MNKKIIINFIIFIAVIIIGIKNVEAANEYQIELENNNKTFQQGEVTEIQVKTKGITEDQNIAALDAIFEYDENVWESISFSEGEKWDKPSNLSSLIQIFTKDLEGLKEDTTVMTIKLKAKENVSEESTTITLKNIELCDDEYKVTTIQNANINLTKAKEEVKNETNTENNNKNNQTNEDSDKAKGSLPYAGNKNIIVLLMLGIIIITIFIYKKSRKYMVI